MSEGKNKQFWWAILFGSIILLGLCAFAYRSYKQGGYFTEDAYISLRFATNFANGNGLVWNVGGERVEGYTSPVHIFLLAVAIKSGLAATKSTLVIGIASILGLLGLFVFMLRREAGALVPIGAIVAFVFLVDFRLAVHATAGLDTPLYFLLLAICYCIAVWFVESPGWRSAAALAVMNVVCLLGRPDAAPFIAGQGLVVLAYALLIYRKERSTDVLRFSVVSYLLLVAIGASYLTLKYFYFGYVLPNPFYIKSNDYLSFYGLPMVVEFLEVMAWRLGPIILLSLPFLAYAQIGEWWKKPGTRIRMALMLVPPAVFLFYYTMVIHEVSYLSRFEYPSYFFFCLAVAIVLSVGNPVMNLFDMLSKRITAAVAGAVIGVISILALGSILWSTHYGFPWFRIMETKYYRPIGEALASTDLGPKGKIVFDSAGIVPFVSEFTHIDPVGLTENALSGRDPMTVEEREKYIWGTNPDVYIGPEPPASGGATNCESEPLVSSEYLKKVLLYEDRFQVMTQYLSVYGRLSPSEQCEIIHMRMRELRDNWEMLGEFPHPAPQPSEYTTFVYVRKESPYKKRLTTALTTLVTNEPEDIDYGIPGRTEN
ncbi:MAG: hypothetical protein DWQ47_11625 [Acidobacteria bacterium]|nr:MAG: hypothetical protein DWQ32_14040 [Acidobacteriota bacterium]REJ98225.1 MAG: hypothetical protein DWQ38_16840 [Acidobacteriota bacterium]REK16969.1 MAG: hypothetical protein DWQ43_01885 [Acidobacteriota bacterium]REK42879.1 MAG: hypothetical protein DWQ47_11625 [Acidobacteriota bacterium]